MKRVLVLNGPNLDRLGERQPEIYGSTTLAEIERSMSEQAGGLGLDLSFVQSNDEATLAEAIVTVKPDGIVINPAAFTHFSHLIADALASSGVPVVEVHLSNIHAREPFRRLSVVSPIARAVICGCGPAGYGYALDALARIIAGGSGDSTSERSER